MEASPAWQAFDRVVAGDSPANCVHHKSSMRSRFFTDDYPSPQLQESWPEFGADSPETTPASIPQVIPFPFVLSKEIPEHYGDLDGLHV